MQALVAMAGIDWSNLVGPFHVVMLHYPIGFLTLAVLLEAWTSRRPSEGGRRAVGFTLGLSVLVAWLVVWLGLMRAGHGGFDPQVLRLHKVFGIAVATLSTLCWWLHRQLYPEPERVAVRRTYRGLLGLSFVLLGLAGHQGGTLTHGSRFLSEGLPPGLASLMMAAEATPANPVPHGDTYAETIRPLFAKKCVQCHGPDKQKSGYRLDDREIALKGGKSGEPAIVPSDPMKSRLVKALFLPPEDDGAMPPEGKERLTAEEIVAVVRWIQAGAPFGSTAK